VRRAAFLAALFLSLPGARARASGANAASAPLDPLAAPGAYSLAPAAPSLLSALPGGAPLVAGGVASTAFGSHGMHGSSIELDSGLIGNNTHAFVAVGGGQGPHWHDAPSVSGRSFAAGVSTALPFGTTLSVTAGVDQVRLARPN
jgi:hypothetical protein